MKNITKGLVVITTCLSLLVESVGCDSLTTPSPITISIANRPPQPPSALTTEEVTNSTVTLRWTDRSDNEKGFRIFRDGQLIATTNANINVYWDDNLNPATVYQYAIKSFNQAGESDALSREVKTKNPAITITLDKIGVYDNGESFTRDSNGGEVYVYVVVTDGDANQKTRVPADEEAYLTLRDNEIAEVGRVIYSTEQIGDTLGIAFVGYESDGGPFEELVYQALGTAASAQVGGAGGLLGSFNLNLDGLIGSLLGSEDDWLGSYEAVWNSSTNWGIGKYEDIVCLEDNGSQGLRLWFTISSPDWPPSSQVTIPTSTAYDSSSEVPHEDQIILGILDVQAFSAKYPNGVMTQFPVNEYGFYLSELIPLQQIDTAHFIIQSSQPLYLGNNEVEDWDGLSVTIFRRLSTNSISSADAKIVSYQTNYEAGQWISEIIFTAAEAGDYQISVINRATTPTAFSIAINTTE